MEYRTKREIEFPSVTICNYNFIRKTYIERQNDPVIRLSIDIVNPYANVNINYSDPKIIKELSSVSMEIFGLESAHLQPEMFVSCSFMSNNASENPCSFHKELFIPKITSQMGTCFTFHPQSYIDKYGALVSKRAGLQGGLSMKINIQQEEYQVAGEAAGLKVGIRSNILKYNSYLK